MPGIKAIKIGKSFPGVRAVDDVSLEIKVGEVHAMVGANGAGKSTFAKIISGAYSQYDGKIEIDGEEKKINTPAEALNSGIVCVHQEVDTALVGYLTVAENLLLFEQTSGEGTSWINWRKLNQKARQILDEVNFLVDFDVKQKVMELSLADKQLLVIIRAICFGSKYIIFDEPTAALSRKEVKFLFEIINELKKRGLGILYISHRMPEVFEISDRITVLKDGQKIDTLETKKTSVEEIIKLMLGRKMEEQYIKEEVPIGDIVLEVSDLRVPNKIDNISLQVRKGEILGITGLVGAGKTELARTIFGAEKEYKGSIKINGKEVKVNSPVEAIRSGIYLVPEERREQGLLVNENVKTNLTLPSLGSFCNYQVINKKEEENAAQKIIESLKIVVSSLNQLTKKLSGGNQQKVSVGKWMLKSNLERGQIFIFDDPTKGIDVGAKKEIYHLCYQLARQGLGIIYISPEIPEIIAISDRILVMYDKKIVAELSGDQVTRENILKYATGGVN